MSTTYAIEDTAVVIDAPEKRYILKVRDLPLEAKPREKLLKLGAKALSVQELLTIVLGSGTKKEGVLEMSSRILKEYGERVLIHYRNPASMADELGIPLIKAMQIVAAGELGRRYFDKNDYGLSVIRNAKEAFEYLSDMRTLSREHLRGIYLNAHHRVIHDEVISVGTINSNLVHPREVFKSAIEYGAVALLLAHNHPSNDPTPSLEDVAVTKQLIQAGKILGIHLLDHIIVTKDSFMSIDVDYA